MAATIRARTRSLLLSALVALATGGAPAGNLDLRHAAPAADTPQGWERAALPVGNARQGILT